MGELADSVIKDWEYGEGDRQITKFHWQEVADLIHPDRNDYIIDRPPGQKRMRKVFDGTPIWANQQFAAGVHSLLTSPTLQWFSLWNEDDRLNTIPRVLAWQQKATDVIYGLFNSSKHNFASQSHEVYLDQGSIGQACMFVLDSAEAGILFSTRHMKEIVVAENNDDRIDQVTRSWKWTAKQATQQWGDKAGQKAKDAMGKNPYQKFTYLHRIRPRLARDPQRADRMNKKFESVYVSLEDKEEIAIGGFDEFPAMVPRLEKLTGETYGRGPGMTALPDVKMLNEMAKLVIKAAQKKIDPPLMLPDDGFIVPIKTVPGSFNFYRKGLSPNDRIAAIETKGDIQLGIEMLNAVRQQIIRAFYVDWFIMPSDVRDPASSGKGITATYVLQQRDEKMRLLSPMLARLQSEFLGPLIDRVFAMLWRKSMARRFGPGSPFPPPPPELAGSRLRVEYVSPIAIAQKTSQLDGVNRLIALQEQLMKMFPQGGGPMILDVEAIMRLSARDLNTPAEALKSPETLAAEAQQKAQAEAALNNAQHVATLAGAAKDAGAGMKSLAEGRMAAVQGNQPPQQQEAA